MEVCLENPLDAMPAQTAGATRIELNSALKLDGLTPTLAACRWLKNNCSLPLIAMLRPREGFYLAPQEQEILLDDARLLLDAGVDGLAYGALDRQGELNSEYMRQVVELCAEREVVCHRAFDRLADQKRGLEQLIDCGVRRVLTSGGAASAEQGLSRLAELQCWSRGRIEVLPGGGVYAGNARRIAQVSGCRQLHGTFRGNPREITALCHAIKGLS
ncbi:MAG: copper homeostasis protein CutC [Aureliella sp.]